MKLEILVTIYKEGFDVLKPLLDSIAVQQNVDWEEIGVIVCNDGGEKLNWASYSRYLQNYPYKIDYYYEEHGGVSACRNKAMDYATAEYIQFCDCDDMYANICGLWLIFNAIEKGFDCFVPKFMEEVRHDGKPQYITRDWDATFIHGKVFNRQYLVENNIRFNEALTLHEDTYFNCLAQQLADNVVYCPTPFYLWKWREDSVVRRCDDFVRETFDELLKVNGALVDELVRRERLIDASFIASNMMYEAFTKLPDWNDERANSAFVKFLQKYRSLELALPENIRQIIQKRRGSEKPIDEQMFQRWLNGQSL